MPSSPTAEKAQAVFVLFPQSEDVGPPLHGKDDLA